VNISALDFKMSIKHVHDIYERVCEFGGKAGGGLYSYLRLQKASILARDFRKCESFCSIEIQEQPSKPCIDQNWSTHQKGYLSYSCSHYATHV